MQASLYAANYPKRRREALLRSEGRCEQLLENGQRCSHRIGVLRIILRRSFHAARPAAPGRSARSRQQGDTVMAKNRFNSEGRVTRRVLRKAYRELQGTPVVEGMDAVELSRRLCLLTEAQARAVAIPGLSIVASMTAAWSYDIVCDWTGRHDVGIDALSSVIMQVIEERERSEQDSWVLTEPMAQDDPLFAETHAIVEHIWREGHLALDIYQQMPRCAASPYVVLCSSNPELTKADIVAEDLLPTLRALLEQCSVWHEGRMQAQEVQS